jgi:hypothetical protein
MSGLVLIIASLILRIAYYGPWIISLFIIGRVADQWARSLRALYQHAQPSAVQSLSCHQGATAEAFSALRDMTQGVLPPGDRHRIGEIRREYRDQGAARSCRDQWLTLNSSQPGHGNSRGSMSPGSFVPPGTRSIARSSGSCAGGWGIGSWVLP